MHRYVGPQGLGYLRRVDLRRVAWVGLSAAALLLAGCSGFRPISKIENGGQSFDNLGTVDGTTIDVAKIAPRDTIVVADDGGKAVTTSPNAVEVTMMESFSVPLSLGIPNFDLRFGWMFKKPELDAKGEPPKVFRLASRKLVAVDNDGWMPGGSIALTEKQIAYYTKQYFSFIRTDFVPLVVNRDGKLVAFGITMPSLSIALQKAKGSLLPFGVGRC